jgi:hypothetical protein
VGKDSAGGALYGADLAAVHAAGHTGLATVAARELLSRLTRPSLMVELGCGDGTSARLLTDAGHEVIGVVASSAFVTLASRRAPSAGPGRVPSGGQRTWREGAGWAVLGDAAPESDAPCRRIVTFREGRTGSFRRSEEVHRLDLHSPSEVLARLRAAGFAARTLPRGYARKPLPRGLTASVARKR